MKLCVSSFNYKYCYNVLTYTWIKLVLLDFIVIIVCSSDQLIFYSSCKDFACLF